MGKMKDLHATRENPPGVVEFKYADMVTRDDVTLSLSGFVARKRDGAIIGYIRRDDYGWWRWSLYGANISASGKTIKRREALSELLDVYNVYARSKAYGQMYGAMSLSGGHR